MKPQTDCHICAELSSESLTAHLARAHLNEMLHIETDPSTGRTTIFDYAEDDDSR